MKKRTKEILAGLLVASMLLGSPAGTQAAEAAGQKRAEREQAAENKAEQTSGQSSETTSKDRSEIASKQISQTDPERIPEKITEKKDGVENDIGRENESNIENDIEKDDNSNTEKDNKSNTEKDTESDTEKDTENNIEKDNENDTEKDAENNIEKDDESDIEKDTENDIDNSDESDIEKDDESDIENDDEDNVQDEWVEIPASHFTPEISGEGELDYRTYIDDADQLMILVKKSELEQDTGMKIKLKNSPLHDSDFYIELSCGGQVRQYTYAEWTACLESCQGWVNDEIAVKLTDTGKKYFDTIQIDVQESETDRGKKIYTIWAEDSGTNASTKDVENGTRTYTAGRDTQEPVLKDFCADDRCYEPTRTDTEQYFAQDFVLSGTFFDDISGVQRIEYTTDNRPGEDSEWIEVAGTPRAGSQDTSVDFEIVLTDGCYPAIAVRAFDEAGNVSGSRQYVNDAGGYISVVVDSSAPVLQFDVTAGGQPYSGEEDNWTNKDVNIRITPAKGTCAYAGICQYEYVYQKIGEAMTDEPEAWTALPVQYGSLAELTVTEDRNGYYRFRAVSASGVATTSDACQRVLIQHQAAAIRPILVSGADETKRKNGWYNKQSGTPEIRFAYPDYDTGAISKEYDAPITLHYELFKSDTVPDTPGSKSSGKDPASNDADGSFGTEIVKNKAMIGVMSSADVKIHEDGSREFVLARDDLERHGIELGTDDGFYTLRYWTADKAGNMSEKQVHYYKIDCHEPTDLTMELAGSAFEVGKEPAVTYRRFYRDAVSGSADAQYGISGKGSLVISGVKKIGEWKNMERSGPESADSISISPNTRCFFYIRAEDEAGNVAEGWTNGIVVDNLAPNDLQDKSGKELMLEPRGANEHGFFNDDIIVDIRIKDAPEDGNCSALQTVTSTVGRDGVDTVTRRELFSFVKQAPTEEELTAASGFVGTQRIDAAANESNEAYVEVTATDRSGNTKTSTRLLKIDVTKPEIDITFDGQNALNGRYYRKGRTVTIHVHELNFDPGAVSVSVTKDGEVSQVALSDWRSDGSEHYASFTLTEDGEYSVTAGCVDLADNASELARSEVFTIDRTAPEMTIALTGGRSVQTSEQEGGQEYFNTDVTAVITVTERNFRTEDFAVNMTLVSEKGAWSHDGDTHILQIPIAGDGLYQIQCTCTDMAGNAVQTAQRSFIIDTAAPVIRIDGVAEGSANSGAILPVITVLDPNITVSDISLSVRTGVGDIVANNVETAPVEEAGSTGFCLTLKDMTEKADNVYYLTVSARDQAGNEAECIRRFSLNRNGSVYDLSSFVQLMEKQYNTYDAIGDIQIIEMNIDTVEDFELYVSRNGAIGYEADYTKERFGSADTGYTYLYQVKRENFAEEGIYRISLYSRDRAGNEVNNTTRIHGEEIVFVIDNTAPRVVIDGAESGKVYDVESQQVRVVVTDNFKLAEAELTLVNQEDEVLGRWDYMVLSGENEVLDITIPQCDEHLSLLYRVKDAAGNELQTFQGEQETPGGFLVTTDKLVQYISSPSGTPQGRMFLWLPGVLALSGVLGGLLIRRLRAKRPSGQ